MRADATCAESPKNIAPATRNKPEIRARFKSFSNPSKWSVLVIRRLADGKITMSNTSLVAASSVRKEFAC